MSATIIDVETTGLDNGQHKVIEISALTFEPDTDQPRGEILNLFSTLVIQDVAPSEEITRITGIKHEHFSLGMRPEGAWLMLQRILDNTGCIVAHNAEFDIGFIKPHVNIKVPVIDTMTAIPLPKGCGKSLREICLMHRVRSIGEHRAFADCIALYQVLMLYNWQTILERARSPIVEIVADLSYDAMTAMPDDKKPKAFGFRWNPERKIWVLKIPKCDLSAEYPFQTIQQEGRA